ncbi:hypothetical protein EXIGLDRAFT_815212 [Exidia glandulosa HHB12029]|uniref:DUF6593 domain-containing protein n=1 Tax=Exidia glandulosa HHB12029 TaxID=1314781 RepID=A0A165BL87_EXIGL|nr:hypothetical protein EXIGLDRAFT_815212 [Exidia glandulosa HHB12029]
MAFTLAQTDKDTFELLAPGIGPNSKKNTVYTIFTPSQRHTILFESRSDRKVAELRGHVFSPDTITFRGKEYAQKEFLESERSGKRTFRHSGASYYWTPGNDEDVDKLGLPSGSLQLRRGKDRLLVATFKYASIRETELKVAKAFSTQRDFVDMVIATLVIMWRPKEDRPWNASGLARDGVELGSGIADIVSFASD